MFDPGNLVTGTRSDWLPISSCLVTKNVVRKGREEACPFYQKSFFVNISRDLSVVYVITKLFSRNIFELNTIVKNKVKTVNNNE